MYTTETIWEGQAFTIRDVAKDGICSVSTFLEGLPQSGQNKAFAIIKRIADVGLPRNDEKFVNEGNGIYAIKTKEIRIYCFFSGKQLIVLTHGFKKHGKGGKKVQRRERTKAEEIRSALGLD